MASFNKILKGFLCLFLTFTTATFAQNHVVKLQKNYNFRAKELRQSLNEDKDSLILDADLEMYKIEFLQHPEFKQIFRPYSKQVTLPINDLPIGRTVIAVHVNRKIILFNIVKSQPSISELLNKKASKAVHQDTIKVKLKSDEIKTSSVTFDNKIRTGYWAVSYTSNGFSGHQFSGLVNERTKNRLIKKNRGDLVSFTGKRNRLVIWEVYDIDLFMESKIESKEQPFSITAKGFNETPLYKSQE